MYLNNVFLCQQARILAHRCAAHCHMRPRALNPMHACKMHTGDAQQLFAPTHARTCLRHSSVAAKAHVQVLAERTITANGNRNPYSMPQHPGECTVAALRRGRQRSPCHLRCQPTPHILSATVNAAHFEPQTHWRQTAQPRAAWAAYQHVLCPRCSHAAPADCPLSAPQAAQAMHSKNPDQGVVHEMGWVPAGSNGSSLLTCCAPGHAQCRPKRLSLKQHRAPT